MKLLMHFLMIWLLTGCVEKYAHNDARNYAEPLGELIKETVKLPMVLSDDYVRLYPDSTKDPWIYDRQVTAYDFVKEGFIMGTADQNSLHLIRKGDDWSETIMTGRRGKGPREFQSIDLIKYDGRHVYVYDSKLARLSVFDNNLNFLESRSFHWYGMNPVMATTQEYLIARAHDDGDYLLTAYSKYPELNEVKKFLPRLLTPGIRPMAINDLVLASDASGSVYVVFKSLPYIIKFNSELEHLITYELNGLDIEEFFTVPSRNKPSSDIENAAFVRILISGLAVSENGTEIFIEIGGRIIKYDLANNLQEAQFVIYSDEQKPVSLEHLNLNSEELCAKGEYTGTLICFKGNERKKYHELTAIN